MATPVHELDLPTIDPLASDPTSADGAASARAALVALRDRSWIAKGMFGYTILTYEDCQALLRDRRFHNASSRLAELSGMQDNPYFSERRESILSAEGDTHARLRRLVAPAFTPKAADRLRPFMREVINDLVDPFAADGRCEFVADVCEPYPIPIMCELLGAPKEDWRLFSVWAGDLLRIFNFNLAEDLPIIARTSAELDAYAGALIERRRVTPADDLITDLIAAEEAGDRLSHDELLSLVNAVIVGGTDTTRNQLACTVALFTRHPDQWRLLADRPELAPRAVEESMRVLGAIRGTGRFASEDIEYKGVLFPKDTFVSPSFVAANTDPAVFPEADFDITREGTNAPHLTFGSGIHYCLGAWLARAELQEALPILARRMPDLEVDGEITWKPNGFGIWGPERLPLRFTPAA